MKGIWANKELRFLVIALGGLGLVVGVAFFFLSNNDSNFDWEEHYKGASDQPFGLNILKDLLKDFYLNYDFIELDNRIDSLLYEEYSKPANYVYVGKYFHPDEYDLDALLWFVENGNTAFISSKTLSYYLEDYFDLDRCKGWTGYYQRELIDAGMNFEHPNLKADEDYVFKYVVQSDSLYYFWQYIDNEEVCYDSNEEPFVILGKMNKEYINFVSVPYGKGKFLLHTSPLVFTNYNLLKKGNLEYASKCFSHLAEGDILWDTYNKENPLRGDYREIAGEGFNNSGSGRQSGGGSGWGPGEEGYGGGGDSLSGGPDQAESPLQFILLNQGLRWAWYLLIILILVYIVFQIKRRQRIIPVLERNTNTSLEFVETIGRLYFQTKNHKHLIQQKMRLFLTFIRNRYHVSTSEIDDAFIRKVSAISEVPEEQVNNIFSKYDQIVKDYQVPNKTLWEFHNMIDYFYKNCK